MFQRGKAMAILDTIIKRLRDIKRRRMLSGREPDAARLQEITDATVHTLPWQGLTGVNRIYKGIVSMDAIHSTM